MIDNIFKKKGGSKYKMIHGNNENNYIMIKN